MEEEIKKESYEESKKEGKGALTVTADLYSFLIALATLALFFLYKVLLAFGVINAIVNGIFTIILLAAGVFGFGFAYIRDRKMSHDVILSIIIMCLVFMCAL